MARIRDKQRDHERYMANREAILAQQKIYRETHKEEIKAKRRQRDFERKYLHPKKPARTRKEITTTTTCAIVKKSSLRP